MASPELAGNGYASPPIEGVGEEKLWAAMLTKIKGVADFLPVTDVACEDKDGGAYKWRSMKFVGPGPMHGATIVEHIYADRATGEIRFVGLDAEGSESGEEVVNVLLRDPLRIEYYKRSTASHDRLHWPAPLAGVVSAIDKTVEVAKASCAELSGGSSR